METMKYNIDKEPVKEETKNDIKAERMRLFLSMVPGIGNKTMFLLDTLIEDLKERDNYDGLTDLFREVLNEKQFYSFLKQMQYGKEDFVRKIKYMTDENIHYLSIHSKDYPWRLKKMADCPYGIYMKGKMMSKNAPSVAIIGARQCSEYGKRCAYEFGRKLSEQGVTIISGMARGVDGYAMRGALEGEGQVYGVLGCSVENCYPKENKDLYDAIQEKGGLISEYPLGTKPESRLFPARNRIISGLADIVLVVEARSRSGTYITITQALEQGKEIFAVPGRITDELSKGCNRLIMDGAGVASCAEDILDELKLMGWNHLSVFQTSNENCSCDVHLKDSEKKTENSPVIDSLEEAILSILDDNPKDIDRIMKLTGEKFTFQELYYVLLKLQLKGKIKQIGSGYSLTIR